MIGMQEVGKWKIRAQEKERMYETAAYRANELKRPLVIIGEDGVHPSEVRVGSMGTPDDSCVVFCCYSLEKAPDIEESWKEIVRIAGSPSNIFVAHLKGGLASMSPDVLWDIESAPPIAPKLNYKPRSILTIKPYG
jgi:hypothetical protein